MEPHHRQLLIHFGPHVALSDEESAVLASLGPPSDDHRRFGTDWTSEFADSLEELGDAAFSEDVESARLLFQLALRCRLRLEESESLRLAKCSYILALLLRRLGRLAIARDVMTGALDLRKRIFGASDQRTLFCANEVAILLLDLDEPRDACQLLNNTLKRARLSPKRNRDLILACEGNLADGLRSLGRLNEAYRLGKRVYDSRLKELGLSNRETLASLNNLGFICRDLGRLAEARSIQETVVQVRQRRKRDDPRDLTTAWGNLATTLYQLGESDRALEMERKVLARRLKEDGPNHLDTLIAKDNLAGSLRDLGEFTEARRLLEEVIQEGERQGLGEHHQNVMAYMNLADLLVRFREFDTAESHARKAYAIRRRRYGARHPDTLLTFSSLAAILWEQGKRGIALRMRKRIAAIATAELGPDHTLTLLAKNDLASALVIRGHHWEAIEIYRDVTLRSSRVFGARHGDMLTARISLAESLMANANQLEAVGEARHVVKALYRKPFAFTEDYSLAHRAFSLLIREPDKRLASQFRTIGALLRHSLETLDIKSLQILRPNYLAFTDAWLEYCRASLLSDVTLPLIAAQGFDEVVASLSETAVDETKANQRIRRWQRARQALRDVRRSLHELNGRLVDQDLGVNGSVREQLDAEYQRQLAEEERLSAKFRKLSRDLDISGVAEGRSATEIDVSLTVLSGMLEARETLVVVFRTSANLYQATIASGRRRLLLTLTDFAFFVDGVATGRGERNEGRLSGYRHSVGNVGERTALAGALRYGRPNENEALSERCSRTFWKPLQQSGLVGERVVIVTTLGLQGQPLDCGNPGIETCYYTSILAAYRSLSAREIRQVAPRSAVLATGDAAWQTRHPIPFVEAEGSLIRLVSTGGNKLTPQQLNTKLRNRTVRDEAHISIACHGVVVGNASKKFSVLAIDLEKGVYLSPTDFLRNARVLRTLYLSACMGGVGSDASEGDPLGLVGSLQRIGTCSIIASPAPLPDFYMPIFSLLYWQAVVSGATSSRALLAAKDQFRSGNWPEQFLRSIRKAYRRQILEVLNRYHELKIEQTPSAARSRRVLSATATGWLWPAILDITSPPVSRKSQSPAELFDLCATPHQRNRLATQLAEHLIAARAQLPTKAIDSICDFMMSFG